MLQHRYLAWTRPDTSSLLLGTLNDLARSRSELVAENAFLRQQLIVLRRQVKRPVCNKTDRMLLVLLARIVRTCKQALFIVQPETRLALASPGLSTLLEIQVPSSLSQAKDLSGDRDLDQTDGKGESTVGSRTHPGRIAQAEHQRVQADYSEVHESCMHHTTTRTDMEHVFTDPCPTDLGVRLSASD